MFLQDDDIYEKLVEGPANEPTKPSRKSALESAIEEICTVEQNYSDR